MGYRTYKSPSITASLIVTFIGISYLNEGIRIELASAGIALGLFVLLLLIVIGAIWWCADRNEEQDLSNIVKAAVKSAMKEIEEEKAKKK